MVFEHCFGLKSRGLDSKNECLPLLEAVLNHRLPASVCIFSFHLGLISCWLLVIYSVSLLVRHRKCSIRVQVAGFRSAVNSRGVQGFVERGSGEIKNQGRT